MKNLENFGNIDLYGVRVAAPPETGEIIKNLETCKILKFFALFIQIGEILIKGLQYFGKNRHECSFAIFLGKLSKLYKLLSIIEVHQARTI